MKPHFSIRALLILTTLVGIACWWRLRPSHVAQEFVRAVNAGDFAHADAMFHDEQHAFVAEFMNRDNRNRATARVEPQSVRAWLLGSCRVDVELVDFEGLGAVVQVDVPVDALGLRESHYTSDDSEFTGFFDPQINNLEMSR